MLGFDGSFRSARSLDAICMICQIWQSTGWWEAFKIQEKPELTRGVATGIRGQLSVLLGCL